MNRASAPAKIILFGEHFVVYNQPIILASINKRIKIESQITLDNGNTITIETNRFGKKTYQLSILNNNPKKDLNDFFYPIIYILKKIISNNNKKTIGIEIKIDSEIPYGVGLGSSAALSVAAVSSINSLYNKYQNKKDVLELAIETERIIHKNSSGADCVVSMYGGLMYYQKNKEIRKLKHSNKLNFVIINSGVKHATGNLVSIVQQFKQNNFEIFHRLSKMVTNICENAIGELERGNSTNLGKLMNENQTLLEQIGVSNKGISKIIDSSLNYGALGSKITGAGGGGCVLSLIHKEDEESFLSKMRKCGYECFDIVIENQGIIIEDKS
ncbi:MAG TPA: mevalonate kinase [Nitrososphaeraceae archaeon]|jgi:mevalonate kinase|nr:mevalonate kinase [Nitrososphaeraceae archaeon]